MARPLALETGKEPAVLDLFYIAVGVAGFLALWGIARACDRA
jgi:hypothetical protein